jgi:signal transduction histidine kinase
MAVGLFAMSLPAGFMQLHHLCTDETCPIFWQLSPHDLQALERLGISFDLYVAYNLALAITLMLSYSVVGIIIFWQKRRDGLALFLSLALITWGAVGLFADQLVALQPAWKAAITLVSFTSTASTLVFVYVFPHGRFAPRSLSWLVVVWIALEVTYSFFPDSPLSQRTWPLWLSTSIWIGSWVIGFLSQVYRYVRVSTQIERQQTKWVVFGLTASFGLLLVGGMLQALLQPSNAAGEPQLLSRLAEQFLGVLALVLPPICIGIAILRYRLWDIDLIINRTLVYSILTTSVIGLYVLIVVGLGALFQVQGNLLLSLLATGLIAVVFQPLRQHLQQAVNRLIYGERDEPYKVISQLGSRLEATLAPEEVLPAIVEAVARSLKLPYVAISLKQEDAFKVITAYGESSETLAHLPLTYQAEMIGELILAPRTGSGSFTGNERQLLNELARQAGVAVHGVLLTADLERSRQRIVAAREEARRRLGSDLHDGLGHLLASVLRKVESTALLVEQDAPAALRMLLDLKQHTKRAIDTTRRLAHSLHPPELELLGLVQALCERVQQYDQPNGSELHVRVDAPPALPPLPIAVEAAAYYIALEAVNNVYHHAGACHCHVRLELLRKDENSSPWLRMWNTDILTVEICDDGCGLPGGEQEKGAGLGFASMCERATELGGTCLIENRPTGGTRVCVRLPCIQISNTRR